MVQAKGAAVRDVEGDMVSLGSSANLVCFASAISSISSKEGIEIVGRSVSIPFEPIAGAKEDRMLL